MGCYYLVSFSKARFLSVPFPAFSFLFPFYILCNFTKQYAWHLLLDVRYLEVSQQFTALLYFIWMLCGCNLIVDMSHELTAQVSRKNFAFALQIREKKKTSYFFLFNFFWTKTSSLSYHADPGLDLCKQSTGCARQLWTERWCSPKLWAGCRAYRQGRRGSWSCYSWSMQSFTRGAPETEGIPAAQDRWSQYKPFPSYPSQANGEHQGSSGDKEKCSEVSHTGDCMVSALLWRLAFSSVLASA